MIDLYTALKLFSDTDRFELNGAEYSRKEIIEKFDLRKVKVKKISYNLWNEVTCFEIQK